MSVNLVQIQSEILFETAAIPSRHIHKFHTSPRSAHHLATNDRRFTFISGARFTQHVIYRVHYTQRI